MTAVEFDRLTAGTGPHHAQGWTLSLLCHLVAVGCALMLMAEIEKPVLPSTFQWEVAMVESPPKPEPVVEPAPVPPPPKPMRSHPLERPIDSRPHVESVEPAHQVTHEVVTTVSAVQEIVTPVTTAMERSTTVAQAITSHQETVVEQAVSRPVSQPVTEGVEAVMERTVERQPAVVERATETPSPAPPAVEHRVVQQRLVKYRQTQSDYGWLRDALWRRIEELKRYPTQAKVNHWEGKVIMEAVIRDDGQVVGLKVAESSGHALLDQEAMAVMKKASPLTLKHPLGKPQITILIPISYRLDG